MTFSQAIKRGLNGVFDYRTRSTRSEFWWCVLLVIVLSSAIEALRRFIEPFMGTDPENSYTYIVGMGVWSLCVCAVLLPLSVRRLHDVGRSGAWMLIGVIPFGGVILFYFFCRDSSPNWNCYGDDPKAFYAKEESLTV